MLDPISPQELDKLLDTVNNKLTEKNPIGCMLPSRNIKRVG